MRLQLKRLFPVFFLLTIVLLAGFVSQVNAAVIFSDGFESGDFSAWTGSYGTTGETKAVVITQPHHGTYHAQFVTDGLTGTYEQAYCYKTFAESTVVYARMYIRFLTAFPNASSTYYVPIHLRAGTNIVTRARVYYSATPPNPRWQLYWYNGATSEGVTASTGPSLDTWYCLELYIKIHATEGQAILYIDGTVVCSSTANRDTTYYGNITRLDVGEAYANLLLAHTIYVDCVVVADAYIGPEVTGQSLTFTSQETLKLTDSLTSLKSLQVTQTGTCTITETSYSNKAMLFTKTETAIVTDYSSVTKSLVIHAFEFVFTESLRLTPTFTPTFQIAIIPLTIEDLMGLAALALVIALAALAIGAVAWIEKRKT